MHLFGPHSVFTEIQTPPHRPHIQPSNRPDKAPAPQEQCGKMTTILTLVILNQSLFCPAWPNLVWSGPVCCPLGPGLCRPVEQGQASNKCTVRETGGGPHTGRPIINKCVCMCADEHTVKHITCSLTLRGRNREDGNRDRGGGRWLTMIRCDRKSHCGLRLQNPHPPFQPPPFVPPACVR